MRPALLIALCGCTASLPIPPATDDGGATEDAVDQGWLPGSPRPDWGPPPDAAAPVPPRDSRPPPARPDQGSPPAPIPDAGEDPPPPPPPADERCPLMERHGHRYAFCNFAASWDAARQHCMSLGMDLMVIDALDENERAWDRAREISDSDWWFGLTDREEEGVWKWVDGRHLRWGSWVLGQPDDYLNREDCACFWSWVDHRGGWNDAPCEGALRFICEG